MSVGSDAVLTVLARHQAKLGLLFLDMRRATGTGPRSSVARGAGMAALPQRQDPSGRLWRYLKVVDLVGRHGADAVLRRSGLVSWIGRDGTSLAAEPLDFAEASAWLAGLEETLGARGARGLARRMGAAAFENVLRPVGAIAAMQDPGFQSLQQDRRLRAGLYSLARTFGSLTSTAATA
jgi:hypothetical protein